MKRFLLLLLMAVCVKANAQDISKHYKVYDVKQQKIITIDGIVDGLKNANVLFFGEDHNDSIGHALEIAIFKRIADVYPAKTAVSMEMFHTDIQSVMNEYLEGVISEKNFVKEARAWGNYKDYKPLIEFAKQNKLAVIAANAAARYSNAVTVGGLTVLNGLNKTSAKNLAPLPIDTATGRYYDKFIETLGGHGMGGMKIYQTQNLWDATMAWSIAGFAKANPQVKVLQVNGRFHSDEQLGTFAKLKRYAPKLKLLNISCFSAEDFDNPNWETYKNLGDYVILTDPLVKRSY